MPNVNPTVGNQHKLYSIGSNLGSQWVPDGFRWTLDGSHWDSDSFHLVCKVFFRYQHVGIGNANPSHWGPYPTQSPNRNGIAFWWNIDLMLIHLLLCFIISRFRLRFKIEYQVGLD